MKPCDLFITRSAATMAAEAHAGQTEPSSNTPFIAHPMRVAITVMAAFGCADDEVIAAALLHDTLEKTSLPSARIGEELGPRVLDLVMALTKPDSPDESVYWLRLHRDVWQARLIKMADALDHLDCPVPELPRRVNNARKAMALGFSEEAPIVRARQVLESSLKSADERLETA